MAGTWPATTTEDTMTTRIVTASILTAAALLVVPTAGAAQAQRPAPVAASAITSLQDTVVQLLDEGRHATTIAERRLIHHELVQAVQDGQ
jgi:hypothetical protein